MPLSRAASSLVALALGACSETAELLNSERIEAEFGSYGIDVISHRDGLRRASLYSMHDGGKITRTYAIVHFENVPDSIREKEHARILAGASIGATFKEAGWSIAKETLYTGLIDPGADVHGIRRLMRLSGTRELAMQVYRLHVSKESQAIDYATIVELYHPAYMTLDRLHGIVDESGRDGDQSRRIRHWQSLVLEGRHEPHVAD